MQIIRQIAPLFLAAFILVMMMFGMVLLGYLILFILFVSSLAYVFNRIKLYFQPPQSKKPSHPPSGRIIDSDDWRKL